MIAIGATMRGEVPMRIDAHQHFWRYNPDQYGWMNERMGVLKRDYLPTDLAPELASFDMAASIAVQARQDEEETRWLLELAAEHPAIAGVVGWTDLRAEDVDDRLGALAEHSRLKGVRHVVQDEPDDGFMLRPEFTRGIGCLARHGLRYDILIYARQLPAAIGLVDLFPEQPFVLDHIAKPRIEDAEINTWAAGMRSLAERPNVMCKVSGMITEAKWDGWHPRDFTPYLDVAFEAFGEDRLMFGSDWPVCLLASDRYRTMASLVDEYAGGLDVDAQRKLFGANATDFYGIETR
jgi:L-fuconolactonase